MRRQVVPGGLCVAEVPPKLAAKRRHNHYQSLRTWFICIPKFTVIHHGIDFMYTYDTGIRYCKHPGAVAAYQPMWRRGNRQQGAPKTDCVRGSVTETCILVSPLTNKIPAKLVVQISHSVFLNLWHHPNCYR